MLPFGWLYKPILIWLVFWSVTELTQIPGQRVRKVLNDFTDPEMFLAFNFWFSKFSPEIISYIFASLIRET